MSTFAALGIRPLPMISDPCEPFLLQPRGRYRVVENAAGQLVVTAVGALTAAESDCNKARGQPRRRREQKRMTEIQPGSRITRAPVFAVVRGPIRWFLEAFGFAGITLPWRTIYLLAEWQHDVDLRRQELVHIEQIDREGPVLFSLKYLWWLVRYGYERNPYEIEALEKAG